MILIIAAIILGKPTGVFNANEEVIRNSDGIGNLEEMKSINAK